MKSMWKVVLFLVVLFVAGHFAVQYIRTNPLDPEIEGGEVVVETKEYEVHLNREGPTHGVYLVDAAKSIDWSNEPANVELSLVDFTEARDFLRAYPDFHRYGSVPGLNLENSATRVALIGANRLAYGALRDLVDDYDDRVHAHGERLCLTISGEALRVSSAQSIDEGTDRTEGFQKSDESRQRVFADQVRVDDCVKLAATR
jgi:hypothetical protein